jgi:hypothetical protein
LKYHIVSIYTPADDPKRQYRSGFLHERTPESSWIHPINTDEQEQNGSLNYGSSLDGCGSGPTPDWGWQKI